MNCLEFKRLALSEPSSDDRSFIKHSENCADCLQYVGGVRAMDLQLVNSVEVDIPASLQAKLELNQILGEGRGITRTHFSIAASLVVAFIGAAFMFSFFNATTSPQISEVTANDMVMQMVEHMEDNPVSPVWDSARANKTIKTLMASYDGNLKLKDLARLQFTKICPMKNREKALHANLETDRGQVSFAYIKGDSVGAITDASYKGYMSRIKPIRGGNLLIISRNMISMEEADVELEASMYWDI